MGRGCHDQVCGRQRSFGKQIRQPSFGCRDGARYCVREARLRLKDKPLILRSPDKEPNTPLQGYFSREATVADLRIHGTTKPQVAQLFAEEKQYLLTLPASVFPVFQSR